MASTNLLKRQKTGRACFLCEKASRECDGNRPCMSCLTMGIPALCVGTERGVHAPVRLPSDIVDTPTPSIIPGPLPPSPPSSASTSPSVSPSSSSHTYHPSSNSSSSSSSSSTTTAFVPSPNVTIPTNNSH